MMEAKDTVMDRDAILEVKYLELKDNPEYNRYCKELEPHKFRDIEDKAIATRQAEISFKVGIAEGEVRLAKKVSYPHWQEVQDAKQAGRKEVMEFKCDECATPGFVHLIIPVKKLQEWGLDA